MSCSIIFGAVERLAAAMPTSWTLVMDDYANLLQQGYSTSEMSYRCGSRWHVDEQDGR